MAGHTLTQLQEIASTRAKAVAEFRELLLKRLRLASGFNSSGNEELKEQFRAALRDLENLEK